MPRHCAKEQSSMGGDYFGMFTDKFGIKWMINHREKQKISLSLAVLLSTNKK
jgi:hypothetical protein